VSRPISTKIESRKTSAGKSFRLNAERLAVERRARQPLCGAEMPKDQAVVDPRPAAISGIDADRRSVPLGHQLRGLR
jgi:hypothetical protein